MDGAPLENFYDDDTLGEQPFGAPMPRAFRLSDAERIAAHRLDGAAEGSLKEALATVIVDIDEGRNSLGDRLQMVAPVSSSPLTTPQYEQAETPAMAALAMTPEADFGWFGAVPPAHAVPCFEEREPEAAFVATFTPPPPVVAAPMPVPGPVSDPEAPTVFAAPAADITSEDVGPVFAAVTAAPPLIAPDLPAFADPAPAADIAAPPLALPEDPNLEPMVTAYAASARLAADAAAASQALFELQKLLNQQMLEASPELNDAMEAHGFAGLEAIPVAQQTVPEVPVVAIPARAPDPVTDLTLVPPRLVQQAPHRAASIPPPLPAVPPAPPPEMPLAAAPRRSAPSERAAQALVPSPSRHREPRSEPGRERRPAAPPRIARPRRQASSFDVRGFAAGFALSGAIGVVLYFVVATT